jgi:hypothetical protein
VCGICVLMLLQEKELRRQFLDHRAGLKESEATHVAKVAFERRLSASLPTATLAAMADGHDVAAVGRGTVVWLALAAAGEALRMRVARVRATVPDLAKSFGGTVCRAVEEPDVVVVVFGLPPGAIAMHESRALTFAVALRSALESPESLSIGVDAGELFIDVYAEQGLRFVATGPAVQRARALCGSTDGETIVASTNVLGRADCVRVEYSLLPGRTTAAVHTAVFGVNEESALTSQNDIFSLPPISRGDWIYRQQRVRCHSQRLSRQRAVFLTAYRASSAATHTPTSSSDRCDVELQDVTEVQQGNPLGGSGHDAA